MWPTNNRVNVFIFLKGFETIQIFQGLFSFRLNSHCVYWSCFLLSRCELSRRLRPLIGQPYPRLLVYVWEDIGWFGRHMALDDAMLLLYIAIIYCAPTTLGAQRSSSYFVLPACAAWPTSLADMI